MTAEQSLHPAPTVHDPGSWRDGLTLDELARVYRAAMARPCPDHQAAAGDPCWWKRTEPDPRRPLVCQRRAETELEALDATKGSDDMTTATTDAATATERTPASTETPDAGPVVVPLPEGHLACQVCGQAVHSKGDDGQTFAIEKREGQPTFRPRNGPPVAAGAVTVTMCADCRDRRDRAEQITDAHRTWLSRRYRDQSLATAELARALDAAAMVGLDVPDEPSRADIDALLHHLATVGDDMSWLSRFWPVARADADVDSCAARPWSHVTPRQRRRVRALAANVLAERIAPGRPPQPVAPPYGDACLMCGVGSVQVPAGRVARLGGPKSAARSVWRKVVVSPHSLRASGGSTIDGFVCPACAKGIDNAGGSVGPTALELALIGSVAPDLLSGPRVRANRDGLVGGIVGWAALRTATPNQRPWQHMGDARALRSRIADIAKSW